MQCCSYKRDAYNLVGGHVMSLNKYPLGAEKKENHITFFALVQEQTF